MVVAEELGEVVEEDEEDPESAAVEQADRIREVGGEEVGLHELEQRHQ